MKLLSPASANSKTRKTSEGQPDYRIVTLALSPDKSAAGYPSNCPASTASCVDACVGGVHVGMSQVFKSIQESRARKTAFMRDDRSAFVKQLIEELHREQERAHLEGTVLAVRLNCYSDLPFFLPSFGAIPDRFPQSRFWDYSKMKSYLFDSPDNYHFTFSRTEHNEADCAEVIERGHNVAVIFGEHGAGRTGWRAYGQELPRTFVVGGHRRLVFDGDTNDLRFLDERAGKGNSMRLGLVCGLRLKSGSNVMRDRALASGFAVNVTR
jgi:hypothetical protein